MAIVRDFSALLSGYSWMNVQGEPLATGRPIVLTYSFPTAAPGSYAPWMGTAAAATFQPFNESEKASARQALNLYATASGITFIETSGQRGDIRFSWIDGSKLSYVDYSGVGGWAAYPAVLYTIFNGRPYFYPEEGQSNVYADQGGDVFFNLLKRGMYTDSQHFDLSLHEIGHALGLKHPFEGDPTLAGDLDNFTSTVMSYTGSFRSGLGPLDVAAVQHLYGGPASDGAHLAALNYAPATETLYMQATAGPDRLRGTGTNDHIAGGAGGDTIYGAAGDDVIAGGAGLDFAGGGTGQDTYMTGTVYAPGVVTRYFEGSVEVQVPEGREILTDFEGIRFTNGDYDIRTMTFRADAGDEVFRFYNHQTGSHFYTISMAERDAVRLSNPFFALEGKAFESAASAADGLTVFRFYSTVSQSHFYTASTSERDQIIGTLPQYSYEGPAYFAFASEQGGHTALHRFYQPQAQSHFYTASVQERDSVIANLPQYHYEGVAYFVDIA